jgi:hypothetical protein
VTSWSNVVRPMSETISGLFTIGFITLLRYGRFTTTFSCPVSGSQSPTGWAVLGKGKNIGSGCWTIVIYGTMMCYNVGRTINNQPQIIKWPWYKLFPVMGGLWHCFTHITYYSIYYQYIGDEHHPWIGTIGSQYQGSGVAKTHRFFSRRNAGFGTEKHLLFFCSRT